ARVAHLQPGGQGQQRVPRDHDPFGHPAVPEHPEVAVAGFGAPLGVPAAALLAFAAVDGWLDEITRTVVVHARELAAEDEPGDAGGREVDVGTADTRAGDRQPHAVSAGFCGVDDADPVLGVHDCAHIPVLLLTTNPWQAWACLRGTSKSLTADEVSDAHQV